MALVRSIEELEDVLRSKLLETNLSVRKIAAETEMSKTQVQEFKLGKRKLPIEHLNALANFFEVKYRIENH